jgi:hypothetical protein
MGADVNERSLLGPADLSDGQLAFLVARGLGADPERVTLLDSLADAVDYALPSLTTAGRYWVDGHVSVDGEPQAFRVFCKHVQSWSRSPLFSFVPVDARPWAEVSVPWRTEPLVYRSDLARRLPDGLAMPRALGVFDLDETSSAVWLEALPVDAVEWDLPRYVHAARLLGRLAASPRVRELARIGRHPSTVRDYLSGRLRYQVLPTLRSDALWQHPLVAATFDRDLREGLRRVAEGAPQLMGELAGMPLGTAHGDACPNNLLVSPGREGFVLIDFGFWSERPVGYDLAQLVVGEIQLGRRSAQDLAELDEACLEAYCEGLVAEGSSVATEVVRRAHALQLVLFNGLSSVPFELLGSPPTAEAHAVAHERSRIAAYSLDLLAATVPA